MGHVGMKESEDGDFAFRKFELGLRGCRVSMLGPRAFRGLGGLGLRGLGLRA